MSYLESAGRGEVVNTTRYAVLNGTLWAIALAWATAIRAIVIELLPSDTHDVVAGEILAAVITTALAVLIAIVVARRCSICYEPPAQEKAPAPSRRRIGASRRARVPEVRRHDASAANAHERWRVRETRPQAL